MREEFALFCIPHLLILAGVPILGGVLAAWSRAGQGAAAAIRITMAVGLVLNEILGYAYKSWQGWIHFPHGLPLHLCDFAFWITVIALMTRSALAVDLAYYWVLAGTTMALLTPDLSVPLFSFPAIQFFLSHGGVVAGVLVLIWSGQGRPRPGSVWMVFGISCGVALALALFNMVFDTNYMYLCEKPAAATILDLLGPWPLYVGAGTVMGFVLLLLLSIPYRLRVR